MDRPDAPLRDRTCPDKVIEADAERLRALLSRPYVGMWLDEVLVEAAHQRERWGEHDQGKEPHDWYWLLAYLAGKALKAQMDGDVEKARHHTVSSAAVLAQWAASISGDETVMRPGVGPDVIAAHPDRHTGGQER